MKRHNEGYVLVYVMVAVVLLCALGAAVCSIALRNYQSQQASVERMQQLYEAEGRIERFVAQAQNVDYSENGPVGNATDSFYSKISNLIPAGGQLKAVMNWKTESAGNVLVVTLTAVSGDVSVNAKLRIVPTITDTTTVDKDGEGNVINTSYSYTVTVTSVTYDSYEIGGVEQGEGGETE